MITIVYNVNFFGGFIVSSAIYWILCKISPIPATSDVWYEVDEDEIGRNNSLVYGIDDYDPEYGSPHTDVKGAPKLE